MCQVVWSHMCSLVTWIFLTFLLFSTRNSVFLRCSLFWFGQLAVKWLQPDKNEGKVKGPYFSIYERFFIFITAQFKVNESRYIALFAFSWSIKKLFSIDCVNTYLFSIFFSIYFTRWERMGLPHIAYIIIH